MKPCLKFWSILAALYTLTFLTGCAGQVKIPDFKAYVTLPASQDGYWTKTVSDEEGRVPKEEWAKMIKRALHVMPEDWAILRNTLLENCLTNSCKDVVGIFDNLFYTLDSALKKSQP